MATFTSWSRPHHPWHRGGCSFSRIHHFFDGISRCIQISTGLFAIFDALTGQSHILLSLAALHNLGEWIIIFHFLFPTKAAAGKFPEEQRPSVTVERLTPAGALWIWTVIAIVNSISLKQAMLVELLTGVFCDFFLGLAFPVLLC